MCVRVWIRIKWEEPPQRCTRSLVELTHLVAVLVASSSSHYKTCYFHRKGKGLRREICCLWVVSSSENGISAALLRCWTYLVYTGPTVYPDALKRPGVKRWALHCLFFINVWPAQIDGWEHVEEPRWFFHMFSSCLSTSIFIQIRWSGLERELGVLDLWGAVVVLVGFQCFNVCERWEFQCETQASVKMPPWELFIPDWFNQHWLGLLLGERETEGGGEKTRYFFPSILNYSMLCKCFTCRFLTDFLGIGKRLLCFCSGDNYSFYP